MYLPNCVDLSGFAPEFKWREKSIVYVGRLSDEKGVETLIDAVSGIGGLQLKIIGAGPLGDYLEKKVRDQYIRNVSFLGVRTGQELKDEVKKSMFLVIPSDGMKTTH